MRSKVKQANQQNISRVNILGVGLSAVTIESTLSLIDSWIRNQQANYVCVTGVHGIIESQRNERIREIHNGAGLVTPDGMPLVWVSRLKGYTHVERVYGPDLMLAICSHSSDNQYRHFFYGGAEGVPEKLAENLKRQFPDLNIVGTYSPPFRKTNEIEEVQIINMIKTSNPDIIWVGLSTPKQEIWMADHLHQFENQILIGVGAAFDFHSGYKQQSPLWMQRIGMEWFFRLLSEPKRLWKRYLINNPLFICLILSQSVGLKRYSLK